LQVNATAQSLDSAVSTTSAMVKKRIGKTNLSKPVKRRRKQSQISTPAPKATSNFVYDDSYDIVSFRGSNQSHLHSDETDGALKEELDEYE
jgi:hypothetical protein